MAERNIINQAAINAAIAQQRAAQERVTAAEKAKQGYVTQQAPVITKAIGDLSSRIKGFTQALESGKKVKDAKKSVKEMLASGKEIRSSYYSGLEPFETEVTTAQNILSGITIPGAIYEEEETGPKLAKETFRKTLALFFGAEEAAKPWVDELYKVVSGYYKTGSTIDESLNLSLRDARNNPNLTKFTNRFRAIFSLEDKLRAGQAVYVPTIAEYVQTEAKVGDIFRLADLPTLANQDTIADVLSLGKSVSEITGLVNNVFNVIDNAPEIWKKELSNKFPTATRSGLATAILLGEKSARELEKTTQISGVQAAAKAQGLSVSEQRAQDIFAQGYGFAQAMPKFGEVAQILPRAQQLAAISKREPLTQLDVEQARIENIAAQQKKLQDIAEEEAARFAGRFGGMQPMLASQRRANRAF